MDHQLHAAAFIEKSLGDNRLLRGNRAQNRAPRLNIFHNLLGATLIQAAFLHQPTCGRTLRRRWNGTCFARPRGQIIQPGAHLFSNVGHLLGQFWCPGGRFAPPKRNVWRRAFGIFNQYRSGLYTANAPGIISQEHDVAPQTLDGKVFIDGADDNRFRLGNHGVERILGNGTAAGNGSKSAAAPPAQAFVDLIVMQVRAVAATPRGNAFGQHRDNLIEFVARQVAKRKRPAYQSEEVILLPILGRTCGDDLLRQYVDGSFRNDNTIKFSAANGAHQSSALDQFVARRRKESAFRDCSPPVSGPAHTLQPHRD